ncbi:MAG: hypothetical protein WCJ30_21690, partial [Deltaproteobacteria bacterium]
VRDYDGARPGAAVNLVTVHTPLDIVRRYDDRDDPPAPVETGAPTGHVAPGIIVAFDDDGIGDTAGRVRRIRPIPLLGYDGDDVAFTARDPAVQLLSIITDFDALVPSQAARVLRAYDSAGALIRVETALPAQRVVTSGTPLAAGPTVSIGAATTSDVPAPSGSRPRVR